MRSKGNSQGSRMGAVLLGETVRQRHRHRQRERERHRDRERGAGSREELKRKGGLAKCHGMKGPKQGLPVGAQVSPGDRWRDQVGRGW